jgi:hypothetical protein
MARQPVASGTGQSQSITSLPEPNHTRFSLCAKLHVADCTTVVEMSLLGGRNVVASQQGLVGYCAERLVREILVGGSGCIDSYTVGPPCSAGATSIACADDTVETAPPPTETSERGGPSMPEMEERADFIAAGKAPVMPLREKRGE